MIHTFRKGSFPGPGLGGRLGAICEEWASLSWASPRAAPRRASGPESGGPPGCPGMGPAGSLGALCTHPGLLPRCEGSLTGPATPRHASPDGKDRGSSTSLPAVPSGPVAARLPPSGAQALTKVEVMIPALPKRAASQLTKMESE